MLLFLLAASDLFAAVDRITTLSADSGTLEIQVIGRPAVSTYQYNLGRRSYYIVSFRHAVLAGSPRSLRIPSAAYATITAAQYSLDPDVVHV
ncbi:MAG TPA: hypothetical protein VMV68_03020, partial [Spirochaetia bacterium]|nr:hypothetical protein [Spirochaetia bacterium]